MAKLNSLHMFNMHKPAFYSLFRIHSSDPFIDSEY